MSGVEKRIQEDLNIQIPALSRFLCLKHQIPNLIPIAIWVPYIDFWYLAKGITNSDGHAL